MLQEELVPRGAEVGISMLAAAEQGQPTSSLEPETLPKRESE